MDPREYLEQIKATLATIGKMAADIDMTLYDEDAGDPTLRQVYQHLLAAEDVMADIIAGSVERQEEEAL